MNEYTEIMLSFFNSHIFFLESIAFFLNHRCFKMSFNEVKFPYLRRYPYWIRHLNIHLDLSPLVSEEIPQWTVLEKHSPDSICS